MHTLLTHLLWELWEKCVRNCSHKTNSVFSPPSLRGWVASVSKEKCLWLPLSSRISLKLYIYVELQWLLAMPLSVTEQFVL